MSGHNGPRAPAGRAPGPPPVSPGRARALKTVGHSGVKELDVMTSGAGAATLRAEGALRRTVASAGFLLDAARRRRGGRRALWALVATMTLAGVLLLTYPFITNLWASQIQSGLTTEFEEQVAAAAEAPRRFESRTVAVGGALTRLKIPRLGVDLVVVEGISGNALRAGAGHYPGTALPGEAGNVAIAGHRTGFGSPFRHVDRLRPGDEIIMETPVGIFRYEVVPAFDGHPNPWITHARDWSVIAPTPERVLTLTTCDPPGTSKNRLIVRARLVGTERVA